MVERRETSETRKAQIVKAAIDIIGDEGIQGITTAKLAHLVGTSEANLYRHFKNKNAILAATVDKIEESLSNNLMKLNDESADSLERLGTLFKLHITFVSEHKGILKIVFSPEVHFIENLRTKLSSIIENYLSKVRQLIESGKTDGSIKSDVDSEASARLFLGMVQVSVHRWSLSNFNMPLLEESDKTWQAYKEGISKLS